VNYLAHLLLADDTPASRVGNLLPDLHRGRLPDDLEPAVLAGVRRHRRVDAFTDRHPSFERSRARLRPRHGRYSGIIADVLYDHVLARGWRNYHPQPLPAFIRSAYHDLNVYAGPLPQRVRAIHRIMAEQDWLGTYATAEGIALTLRRLSARLRERFGRVVNLASAVDELQDGYDGFADDFEAFFPDLLSHLDLPPRNPSDD
jgi:acyl carrier protein phosphodiesterase